MEEKKDKEYEADTEEDEEKIHQKGLKEVIELTSNIKRINGTIAGIRFMTVFIGVICCIMLMRVMGWI